jgi:RNA polymerase sigma factor (TIGR02999 family)
MPEPQVDVTQLLRNWSGGDAGALDQLMGLVYKELRRLARYQLERERGGHTLQSTALVHEVYVRLCGSGELEWQDRAHFFAVAARMMRRVLVDYARRQGAEKRGGSAVRTVLGESLEVPGQEDGTDLAALNEALEQLASVDARKCQVVEMRFFGGLSAKETAAVLGTTEATVRRDWTIARAWLYRYLKGDSKA